MACRSPHWFRPQCVCRNADGASEAGAPSVVPVRARHAGPVPQDQQPAVLTAITGGVLAPAAGVYSTRQVVTVVAPDGMM
jgi:hypothetical protein